MSDPVHVIIKEETSSSAKLWKFMFFIASSFALLFATDTIEISSSKPSHYQLKDENSMAQTSNNFSAQELNSTSNDSVNRGGDPSDFAEEQSTPETLLEKSKVRKYQRRAQPYQPSIDEELIAKWGIWSFNEPRPDLSQLYLKYPNRDIPSSEFPVNSWQRNTTYLEGFLNQAQDLVTRTMEAILEEYGKGKRQMPGKTFEERSDMFHITFYNVSVDDLPQYKDGGKLNKGGWTTKQSWEGLKRRLLHSIMTEDSFIFAMGGHSAAAGHGNHFTQSYTLQVQWILEAVFARLGVKHQARNFGNGGMSTEHNGLAASSTYGPDLDILMWDSGMTEQGTMGSDLMARQAIMGGQKVPLILNRYSKFLAHLELAGIDVGTYGTGLAGVAPKESLKDIESAPWASRYLQCIGETKEICKQNEYSSICWIERDDIPAEAIAEQSAFPGGRAHWHPGHFAHQLTGRVIAMFILQALSEVVDEWKHSLDYILEDSKWHVSDMFKAQKEALKYVSTEATGCARMNDFGLGYACHIPFKAVTEYTPRNLPYLSSIRSLMTKEMANAVGTSDRPVYRPPDIFNPYLHPPSGEVDVLKVVELGTDFQPVLDMDYSNHYQVTRIREPREYFQRPGDLFKLDTRACDDFCDGTVDSWCDRGPKNSCLLSGHNDHRGGILFNGQSGWIVTRPTIRHGYVLAGIQHWHSFPKQQEPTRHLDKAKVIPNNGTKATPNRIMKKSSFPDFTQDFRFEASIQGKIVVSVNGEKFMENLKRISKVGHVYALLEDPHFTGGAEKEIEVAIRITGTGDRAFSFAHLYYA